MKNILQILIFVLSYSLASSNTYPTYFMGDEQSAQIQLGNCMLLLEGNKLKEITPSKNENNQYLTENKEDKTILEFIDANENSRIEYDIANNITIYTKDDRRKLLASKSVIIKNIYKNIDVRLRYTERNKIKYDLLLHPGCNLRDIKILTSNFDNKNVHYQTEEIKSFVLEGKQKVFIKSSIVQENNIFKFEIPNMPKNKTILIDPDVNFSTYYGGKGNDEFLSQKFLSDGSYILTGTTNSSDFPIENDLHYFSDNSEVIVMKFSPDNQLIWCTILAGSGNEYGRDIIEDKDGNIWVTGQTSSLNFPITPNAVQLIYTGGTADGFLAKLDKDGELLYCTYFGSYAYESLLGLAEDSEGNIWASGQTDGQIYTTPNANTKNPASFYDGFVCKFNPQGDLLLASYIAGYSDEACENICIASDDNPVITGWTGSAGIGILGGSYTHLSGYRDAIIMKLDKTTGKPLWGSYFGGESDDRSYDISYKDDSYYITGRTRSYDLPTNASSFQQTYGGGYQDNFVAKFKEGGILEWCSYYGGSGSENETGEASYLYGTSVNSKGELLFSGRTSSNDLPITVDAFQYSFGGTFDGFIAKVSPTGALLYSSYLGGSGNEVAWNCNYDLNGNMVVLGYTQSSDFPVTDNAIKSFHSGKYDAYLVRFGSSCHQSEFEMGIEPASSFVLNDQASYLNDTLFMHTQNSYAKGSVWYHKLLPVDVGFTTEFKFRITRNDDFQHFSEDNVKTEGGLAFVIQNAATNAIGASAQGLGYDGIPEGIAIEFDTYKDDENSSEDLNDPSKGHISVMGMLNGAISANHDAQKTFANVELKDDSTVYQCKIKYDGKSQKLRILFAEAGKTLEEVIQLNIDLTYSIDLKNNMGAYLGFTAANGNALQTHDIFDWKVCPDPLSTETGYGEYAGSDANVFLFPNPTHDNITIHYAPEKLSYTNINLYDLSGKKISMLYSGLDEAGEQTISMPLPDNLAAGVYIIEVDYGYRKESVKVIVE